MAEDLEQLKQRIPLLTYLQRHHWSGRPAAVRSEFVGLCPLHEDTRPSFYVNPRKNLFYCHGCGQGGDLIRFVQLSRHLSFRQSLSYLQEELAPSAQLLEHTTAFYQLELHRYPEGIQYLAQRGVHDPALIEELGIGYARGGNLRPHLQQLGYSLDRLLELGLIRAQGQDAFSRRVIFPCRQQNRVVNLYGRSIGDAFPHRLLPRSKGNLFAWESVRQFRNLILVEGLFDLAALWQAGFPNTTWLRQLSLRSLRIYAYDLLHLARWFKNTRHSLGRLNQSLLLDYVRYQLEQKPSPTAQTINHRLCVVRCLYRFHYGHEIPGKPRFQRRYTTRSPLGYGRRQPKITTQLRVRQPRRVIVPLSADQVAGFWKGFRTFRDLAIVALMLLDGLRSCEVLQLQLQDLSFSEARLHVVGKGRKERFVPVPADTLQVLQNYLHLERPLTNSPALFVSLKGGHRGCPMTAAGLRSLFRHHRLRSRVPQANPHRFRHTFGSDMVRAGMSLPALMHLMGHADIQTTMLYVQIAPEDVWREYARAVAQRVRLSTPDKMS